MSNVTPSANACIGVEISSSAMRAVSVAGNVVTNTSAAALSSKTSVVEQLSAFIDKCRTDFGAGKIGVAVPALVGSGRRVVEYSTHIAELSGLDLVAALGDKGGSVVTVYNDANAAAWAEYHIGAGVGARDMFYATLGTGVGGSFILNGEIWMGHGGYAGEFGYVPVREGGERLEDIASTANIIRRTRSRVNQDSTSSLAEVPEGSLSISMIVEGAKAGDDFSQLMLDRTGNYIGIAVASVINLLNIERVVIGGEIMEAGELILDPIVETARKRSFLPSFETTRILQGELGEDVAAIGAAMLAGLS
ncbi:MAG TPA: ROK family protein [Pyrinomonadaceae bacterium]|nr:ROK family protein [Pyrinomonadaceae bacterium]